MQMRSRTVARKTGINPLPIAVYVLVAVVVATAMYVVDLRYRREEEARRRPPAPEVIARNLLEAMIGAGTVEDVKVDREQKRIAVTIESTQFKPNEPRARNRELVEAEATLATQAVLAQLRDFTFATATLVYQGRTIAVGEAERGRDQVAMTYVDERLK